MAGSSAHPDDFGIGRLFRVTSEAIVVADLSTERIVLWNAAAERVFGYDAEEAVGMRLDRLVPDGLREQHLAGIRRYRETRRAVLVGGDPIDVPAVSKDGEQRDVALTLTDVSDRGEGRFVLAVVRDVTAQRKMERDLSAANQAMRDFVATASHDLRTPLTAIEGYASLLIEHGDNLGAQQHAESLDAIVRAARHASRLVGDLLTLSQIQVGAVAVRGELVEVATIIRQAIDAAGSDAVANVSEGVVVFADPDHLQRILTNYLTNAARYGHPPVTVNAAGRGDEVEICVNDAGEGPPAEFRDRLFTAFAKADPRERDGIGLGLSIVQGLAAANGGTAFFENTNGCTFGVRLPGSVRS